MGKEETMTFKELKERIEREDKLELYCEIIKIKGPVGIGKGIATVDGKTVCEAEILFAIG